MELSGKVEKVRGGVRASQEVKTPIVRFSDRVEIHSKQKEAIALLAIDLISPGDSIFVDSSTTGLSLVRALARNEELPVTILSNNPLAVLELERARHIQFISTGGELHSDSYTYAGDLTLEALDKRPFSKAFVSAGAVDIEHGLMTNLSYLASVKRRAVERAQESILLMDSSKFENLAPLIIAPLSKITWVVSDSGLTSEQVAGIRNIGAKVRT